MRRILYLFFILVGVVCGSAAPRDEIESLLHYVKVLDGAAFVRNGDSHTPQEAEAHLRLKWNKQNSEISTAEDFIRLCATKSSISGQAYIIRFKDGREEEAASVLSKQLQLIRETQKTENQNTPNKALVPTPVSVTTAAGAPVAPDTGAAHL